jgi:N-acetylneuraminic acid mutarotase
MRVGRVAVAIAAVGMFLAALTTSSAFAAPGTWASLTPLPEAEEGASAAAVGKTVVLAYGDGVATFDSTTTRLFNTESGTWSSGTSAPGNVSSEGIGVGTPKYGYFLGGRGGAGHDNNRYSPATDTWTELAPMPTARDGLGAAVLGAFIYAVGGRTETAGPCSGGAGLATVEKYDIQTNKWKPAASLPNSRSDVGVVSRNGKIYAIGGCNGGGVTGEVDIYNPVTNSWSPGAPMPTPRAGFYNIAVKGDDIYVMGGLDSSLSTSPANEVYEAETNTWEVETPMPHPRGEMGVATVGSRIYTMGGGIPAFGSGQATADVFVPGP